MNASKEIQFCLVLIRDNSYQFVGNSFSYPRSSVFICGSNSFYAAIFSAG